MTAPFFSIIMPTYGVEKYISDALEDIQSQTFKDWELIIVDDCSQDKSIEIAKEKAQADSRIRIVHHKQNKGLSEARNTGIKEAAGTYLWIPDPDDRYDCSLLQNAYKALFENPAPVAIMGHTDDFYNKEEQVTQKEEYSLAAIAQKAFFDEEQFSLESKWWVLNQNQLRSIVLDLEIGTHYGYAWNKFYEREYLQQNGFTFETVPLIEDIVFNVGVLQNTQSIVLLNCCPYHYAKREKANLTNKFIPEYFEVHTRRIQILRDQQESWGLLDNEVLSILGGLYARYILSALERNEQAESGFTKQQKRQWCEDLFSSPLFNELIPYAEARNSKALSACLKALKAKNISQTLTVSKIIYLTKRYMKGFFNRLKSQR
ncbi:MAG: glycosyltransferase family 2 protein [Anaerotardibacter sp.]